MHDGKQRATYSGIGYIVEEETDSQGRRQHSGLSSVKDREDKERKTVQ